MRGTPLLFALALVLPGLAGCTVPELGFDQPKRWDLDIPLGLIVSPRGGAALDDVAASAELAARQIQASELGATITIRQDAAVDSVNLAYDRLASAGVAAVIAAVAPEEAAALADRAASKMVPLILVTPADPPARNAAAFLQLAPPSSALGEALAAKVTAANVTVFALSDIYTAAVEAAFDTAYNGTITQRVNVTRGQQGAIIAAARASCATGIRSALLLVPAIEAGWVVRGLQEGGCRPSVSIVAGPSARFGDLVTEAGRDTVDNEPAAAGVVGVEPAGSRLAEFRTFFATEYDRDPGAFAAEAYDAVILTALAAFDAKGAPGAKPVRADIAAGDVQPRLLRMAEGPGVKHRDLAAAIAAAKDGDDVEWAGYAHDFSFSATNAPEATSYETWRVTPTGGIERVRG